MIILIENYIVTMLSYCSMGKILLKGFNDFRNMIPVQQNKP